MELTKWINCIFLKNLGPNCIFITSYMTFIALISIKIQVRCEHILSKIQGQTLVALKFKENCINVLPRGGTTKFMSTPFFPLNYTFESRTS